MQYGRPYRQNVGCASFNPHPARRPDAILVPAEYHLSTEVSILTRPEGRMQSHNVRKGGWYAGRVSILTRPEGRMQCAVCKYNGACAVRVSILTRPEGRMQSPTCTVMPPTSTVFQSSPGQKAGCNVSFMPRLSGLTVFQSSPGQKAGCNPRPESLALPCT